jgi:hypothetical protein
MNSSKRLASTFTLLLVVILCASLLRAEDRRIDPTFLYRDTSAAVEKPADVTTATCHYKPLFGKGDSDTSVVVGVARYGEVVIDPDGLRYGAISGGGPGVRCPQRERLREIWG